MIRIAAYDLRNPLGVVKGYTDMLLEDKDRLTLDHIEFVQLIQEQAKKMFKLIDDILSLQRIEAIQQNKHAAEVDVTELVRDVYVSNEKRAQQKGQTYHLLLPEFPLTFYADVAQLREAMDNLISNAIKYTPDGGSVMVRLDEDVDGEHIVFEVEDTGLGVPEAQQARLFQPFFRASNAKMSQIEGTGLGLHLVKNIIERSGGQMRFRSVVGEGSVFGFTLPVMLRG
jgi:signal transduction histidine kinase